MTIPIPVNEFVTDTVGLILRIEKRRLGPTAGVIFDAVEQGSALMYVPAMVMAEILYLFERKRISASLQDVENYFTKHPTCKEAPMSLASIAAAAQITDIPELHDRLIAGTAKQLNLQLVTNDTNIQASKFVQTVW